VDDAALYGCILTGNQAAGNGGGASECTLNNCTFTGNSTVSGGGAWNSTLNNCTLTGNSAADGGGALFCTLNNCTLTGNSVTGVNASGGGAYFCTLNHCTLTANSAARDGGGAYASTLNNCIVYFNTATNGSNYHQGWWGGLLNYCCTTPMSTNGVGNISNAPRFVDYAGGNLRLQSNSPCINAGLNASAPGPTDLDGNPRIVRGTVDIGAYEFQGPGSVISYAWLQRYGLPTDGAADFADPDADGHTTWQEWRCLTDPTNALSVLRLLTPLPAGTNVTATWQSVAGVSYFLERSTNLSASPPFTLLSTNLTGQPGTTTFTDINASAASGLFYRVGVP
jgi:predicted outer membrane repeat protein